jgi:hypothetical protein
VAGTILRLASLGCPVGPRALVALHTDGGARGAIVLETNHA